MIGSASGKPAQTGSSPGLTNRHASNIRKPVGGTSGSAVAASTKAINAIPA